MRAAELFETFDQPYPLNWEDGVNGDKNAFAKLCKSSEFLK